MKQLLLTLIAVLTVGCSKQGASSPASPSSPTADLSKKLLAIPPDQRAGYVRAHMDQVRSAAQLFSLPKK